MRHRWFWRMATLPLLVVGIGLGLVALAMLWLNDHTGIPIDLGAWLVGKTEDAWRRPS